MNDSANARNQIDGWGDADNASGSADDIHDVFGAAAGSDSVPMSIECADRYRDARLQAKFFGPT